MWGARHIGEPHNHKSGGGLEPLGPIGVYAYVRNAPPFIHTDFTYGADIFIAFAQHQTTVRY